MLYTKRIESVGDASITEHIVEGDFEEVLAIFTELEAKDAVEYHGVPAKFLGIDWATEQKFNQ